MERVDKKTNVNFNEQKEVLDTLENQIVLKKHKFQEEFHQKTTMQALITKMQDDLLIVKKQISDIQKGNSKNEKLLDNEKLKQTTIKEKANVMHSKMLRTVQNNFTNSREHKYSAQYYSTVIAQKGAFHSLMYRYFFTFQRRQKGKANKSCCSS